MDEQMKDRILIAMAILVVICLILTISSSIAAQRNKKSLHRETMLRMDVEEKLLKLTEKTETLKTSLETQLKTALANYDAANEALVKQKALNTKLNEDYLKMKVLKNALEENLKEALVNCKK